MATQFMTEMQAITPGSVQPQQETTAQQQAAVASIGTSAANNSGPVGGATVAISQAQSQTSNRSQQTPSNSVASSQGQQGQSGQQQPTSPSDQSSQSTQQQQQGSLVSQVSAVSSQQQQAAAAAAAIVQSSQAQQFIPVSVSESDSQDQDTVSLQATGQAVHTTYVQYVEGSADQNLYATSNGQMTAYPVYCVSDTGTMYTPATAYYNTGNNTAVTYSQSLETERDLQVGTHGSVGTNVGIQGQILSHQSPGNTYLVQGNTLDGEGHTALAHSTRASPQTEGGVAYLVQSASMDGEGSHLTPTTKVSPATVQWLIDNYETAEGVSLPRSLLYNHYLRHCAEHKIDPVNAASFGKLIRSVFLGLRTRRLGTRGNSKYHYYGIRVKPNSPLNQFTDEAGGMALRQQPINQGKRFKPPSHKSDVQHDGSHSQGTHSHTSSSSSDSTSPPQQQQHQQFLGDATGAIPNLVDIDLGAVPLNDGVTAEDLGIFTTLYKDHCEAFLDAVINLQFSMVDTLWQQFWRSGPTDLELEKQLNTNKLYVLCKCEAVQKFVRQTDYQFYQNLVEVLIPDVLRPIPSSLTQAIRNFAKSLEGWLITAMGTSPEEIVNVKVGAVSAFAQTLRRYTSLNHLAQAARAVLQNSAQIGQMLADLNRVDFHNVQEQASWVCQCDDNMVQKLEQDFKLTLQQQNTLEQWAAWLEGVVTQVLKPHEGTPDFAKAARQFLLKWSFYSSMVIRDLTLRSAASFGSFHLIRLLYDEYMFYVIEHRVAEATGETPIAVMGEFIGYGHRAATMSKTSSGMGVVTNGNHSGHSMAIAGSPVAHGGQQLSLVGSSQGQATKMVTVGSLSAALSTATGGEVIPMAKRLKAN